MGSRHPVILGVHVIFFLLQNGSPGYEGSHHSLLSTMSVILDGKLHRSQVQVDSAVRICPDVAEPRCKCLSRTGLCTWGTQKDK